MRNPKTPPKKKTPKTLKKPRPSQDNHQKELHSIYLSILKKYPRKEPVLSALQHLKNSGTIKKFFKDYSKMMLGGSAYKTRAKAIREIRRTAKDYEIQIPTIWRTSIKHL